MEVEDGEEVSHEPSHKLAVFLQGALTLATSALNQLLSQVGSLRYTVVLQCNNYDNTHLICISFYIDCYIVLTEISRGPQLTVFPDSELAAPATKASHGYVCVHAYTVSCVHSNDDTGSFPSVRGAFESLPVPGMLERAVSDLATPYPLLTLSYINFTMVTHGIKAPLVRICMQFWLSMCHQSNAYTEQI